MYRSYLKLFKICHVPFLKTFVIINERQFFIQLRNVNLFTRVMEIDAVVQVNVYLCVTLFKFKKKYLLKDWVSLNKLLSSLLNHFLAEKLEQKLTMVNKNYLTPFTLSLQFYVFLCNLERVCTKHFIINTSRQREKFRVQ